MQVINTSRADPVWPGLIIEVAVFVYFFSYSIWAVNNLALVLDMPMVERYLSLNFYRLIFVFPNILVPIFTLYVEFHKLRVGKFFPYIIACIIYVLAIAAQTVWLVWAVVDLATCPTHPYCVGNGISVLGMDLAFLIAIATQLVMYVIVFLFLIYLFYVRSRVRRRRIQNYFSRPAQQTTPYGPPVGTNITVSTGAGIGSDMNSSRRTSNLPKDL